MKTKRKESMRQCNHCAEYFDEKTLDGATHLAGCRVYNGHRNYETWMVSLWINNEQSSHEYWRDCAREAIEDNKEIKNPLVIKPIDCARHALADKLKEEITEACEADLEGFRLDMMGAGLSEVAWDDIAQGMIDEAENKKTS